jgi:hypothetical protein
VRGRCEGRTSSGRLPRAAITAAGRSGRVAITDVTRGSLPPLAHALPLLCTRAARDWSRGDALSVVVRLDRTTRDRIRPRSLLLSARVIRALSASRAAVALAIGAHFLSEWGAGACDDQGAHRSGGCRREQSTVPCEDIFLCKSRRRVRVGGYRDDVDGACILPYCPRRGLVSRCPDHLHTCSELALRMSTASHARGRTRAVDMGTTVSTPAPYWFCARLGLTRSCCPCLFANILLPPNSVRSLHLPHIAFDYLHSTSIAFPDIHLCSQSNYMKSNGSNSGWGSLSGLHPNSISISEGVAGCTFSLPK